MKLDGDSPIPYCSMRSWNTMRLKNWGSSARRPVSRAPQAFDMGIAIGPCILSM